MRGGELEESLALHFSIAKAGLSAELAELAERRPAAYAAIGLVFSLLLGLGGWFLAGRR